MGDNLVGFEHPLVFGPRLTMFHFFRGLSASLLVVSTITCLALVR